MFVGNVSEDGFENNPLLDRLKEYACGTERTRRRHLRQDGSRNGEMTDEDRDMFLAEMGQTSRA